MTVLRSKLATDWPAQRNTWLSRLIRSVSANPDYSESMHLIDSWLVEFDENGLPGREIALDENGGVLFSGPDERNYGFWLDTNLTQQDFNGVEFDDAAFEDLWEASRSRPAI